MSHTLLISGRGQVTLPVSIRKKYSLDENTPIILEETHDGILLKRAHLIPVKTYTDKEVEGWVDEDTLEARDKKWLKK